MTKRDYELLASTFRMALARNADVPGDNGYRSIARAGIIHTLTLLAANLADAKPTFDRRKFLFAATGSHDLHLSLLEIGQ
jgi:hypothetical protein